MLPPLLEDCSQCEKGVVHDPAYNTWWDRNGDEYRALRALPRPEVTPEQAARYAHLNAQFMRLTGLCAGCSGTGQQLTDAGRQILNLLQWKDDQW